MTARLVEVLSFEGCPHAEAAVALVRRVLGETGIGAAIRRIDVPDEASAASHRFLGSPTIRVGGRDIEPGADEREPAGYTLSCRIYRTDRGLRSQPDERWLLEALCTR